MVILFLSTFFLKMVNQLVTVVYQINSMSGGKNEHKCLFYSCFFLLYAYVICHSWGRCIHAGAAAPVRQVGVFVEDMLGGLRGWGWGGMEPPGAGDPSSRHRVVCVLVVPDRCVSSVREATHPLSHPLSHPPFSCYFSASQMLVKGYVFFATKISWLLEPYSQS